MLIGHKNIWRETNARGRAAAGAETVFRDFFGLPRGTNGVRKSFSLSVRVSDYRNTPSGQGGGRNEQLTVYTAYSNGDRNWHDDWRPVRGTLHLRVLAANELNKLCGRRTQIVSTAFGNDPAKKKEIRFD